VHFVGLFFVFIIENARSKKQKSVIGAYVPRFLFVCQLTATKYVCDGSRFTVLPCHGRNWTSLRLCIGGQLFVHVQ